LPNARGRLPDFLIIGAAKSGTSTLFDYLCRHSRIYGPEEKEPCFFDPHVSWDRGIDWYRSLFAGARPEQLCFEGSTNYTRYPQVRGVPERIRATVPDAKLIYIVREPVERAYSHYVHRYSRELHRGEPFRSRFEEFVEREPMCIDSSLFATQIDRYLDHFPREHLLLLRFDRLVESPAPLLERVQRFLGVPYEDLWREGAIHTNHQRSFLETRVHASATAPLRRIPGAAWVAKTLGHERKGKAVELLMKTPWAHRVRKGFEPPPMREETREALRERFAPEIERLQRLMGEDLSGWLPAARSQRPLRRASGE
jgi:hypothetical protein